MGEFSLLLSRSGPPHGCIVTCPAWHGSPASAVAAGSVLPTVGLRRKLAIYRDRIASGSAGSVKCQQQDGRPGTSTAGCPGSSGARAACSARPGTAAGCPAAVPRARAAGRGTGASGDREAQEGG